MRHARADDLDRIAPLLRELRTIDGPTFDRMRVTTRGEQRQLVGAVRRALRQ